MAADLETEKSAVRDRAESILADPKRNRGTAFTEAQREKLGLTGLLPDAAEDIDRQAQKPSILIGVSTVGGAFNQKVVETISQLNQRPMERPADIRSWLEGLVYNPEYPQSESSDAATAWATQ